MRFWKILLAALALTAVAAKAPEPAQLSDKDKADIQRIEAYLNGVRTMVSPFLQTASDGSEGKGTIYLQRPGKLRIEYDPPSPIVIISYGGQLIYYDKVLTQVTYVPVSATPAALLVQEQVKLSGEVTVTRVQRGPGVIRVSLVRTSEPEAGQVTLIFSDQPLQLRQWTVVDGRGVETQVALLDPVLGGPIDSKRFDFTDPRTRGGAKAN